MKHNDELVSLFMILDPIMLITSIQSDYGPRGELVVPNCEILEDFGSFSQLFCAFHSISVDFRMPGTTPRTMVVWKI